jgi:hypothetical protein
MLKTGRTLAGAVMVMACLAFLAGCRSPDMRRARAAAAANAARAAAAAAAEAPVVVVAPISAEGTYALEAVVVADMVRQELLATGRFQVIDRSHMDQFLAQKAVRLASGSSEADAQNAARLLNASLMGTGTFGSLMGKYVLTFRLADVETGKARYAGTAEGKSLEELQGGIRKLALEFAGQGRNNK